MYFIRNFIFSVSQSNNKCQPGRSSHPSSVNANKYDGDASKGWVGVLSLQTSVKCVCSPYCVTYEVTFLFVIRCVYVNKYVYVYVRENKC